MSNGTQSIDRALNVLNTFDDDHPTRTLTELVDELGLNKTTIFRILAALENAGYIEKTLNSEYRLGSELIALGGRAARANPLRDAAHPYLKQLTALTGETTTLEVIRDGQNGEQFMLVIDEVLGKHLVGITQYIGTRLPIHATSTGKAILAYMPPDVLQNYLRFPRATLTNATITAESDFIMALQGVQTAGYALVGGELEEGLVAVGAPIFDTSGHPTAAISLVGPSVRLSKQLASTYSTVVIQTAKQISYHIGYRE